MTRWTWDEWRGKSRLYYRRFPLPFVVGWADGPLAPRRFAWGSAEVRHPVEPELSSRVWRLQVFDRVWMVGLQRWRPGRYH